MTPYAWLLWSLTPEFRAWCIALAAAYRGLLLFTRRSDGQLDVAVLPLGLGA